MPKADKNKPLYMISVAADLAGLHPQTLRIYEAKGLVTPQRTKGNTRMYSQADVERLELVSQLTDEGINLAGVMRILDLREQMADLKSEIKSLREQLDASQDEVRELRMRQTITGLTKRTNHSKLLSEASQMESWGDELHN
ncbi:MAG: heat shock protein transcriptional repressor HspR [Coriobacteriales bacterium]|jgi:MerR family transcriptional regulator/heat shock protein HspR